MTKKILLTGAMLICLTGCVTRQIPKANIPKTTQEPSTTEKSTQQETTTENITTTEVEKETTTEEPATDEPDENLNLMQQVLLNQAEFKHILIIGGKVCTNTRTISELDNYDSEYGHSFYYKDLDVDGSYEVCVSGIPYGNITIFSVVDGEIYAFEYPGRAMAPLYTDGTMEGASSATDWGLSRIVDFTKEGIVEEDIVLIDGDINGVEPNRYYTDFVDGHYVNEITEEEYNNIMSQYERIPAEKYDFSRENIEKIVIQ